MVNYVYVRFSINKGILSSRIPRAQLTTFFHSHIFDQLETKLPENFERERLRIAEKLIIYR